MITTIKPKKCKQCRQLFSPQKPLQNVCGFDCAVDYAVALKLKNNRLERVKSRKETKEKLLKFKKLSEYVDEAQREFNKYIRFRDLKAGYGCISCGTKSCRLWVAGHYRTTKAASNLRFNEDNVHLQCGWNCNVNQSGNIIPYRIELVKRIGLERVEALENDNATKTYTKEELIAIKVKYKQLTKQLEDNHASCR